MSEPWVCPICGNVNAPWVPECPCHGNPNYGKYTSAGDTLRVKWDPKWADVRTDE